MKLMLITLCLLLAAAVGEVLSGTGEEHSSSPVLSESHTPASGELIKRQVVAVGGIRGTSTNFVLSSVIGQAATESGTSTNFRLSAGFWNYPSTGCMCGDADGNLIFTISDAVFLINYIFAGGPAPFPLCSGDTDGNGIITISDAVYLINYIFAGGPPPHC